MRGSCYPLAWPGPSKYLSYAMIAAGVNQSIQYYKCLSQVFLTFNVCWLQGLCNFSFIALASVQRSILLVTLNIIYGRHFNGYALENYALHAFYMVWNLKLKRALLTTTMRCIMWGRKEKVIAVKHFKTNIRITISLLNILPWLTGGLRAWCIMQETIYHQHKLSSHKRAQLTLMIKQIKLLRNIILLHRGESKKSVCCVVCGMLGHVRGEGNYDGTSVHSPAPAPARPQFSSSLMDLRIIYKHTQTHKFNIIQTREMRQRQQEYRGYVTLEKRRHGITKAIV